MYPDMNDQTKKSMQNVCGLCPQCSQKMTSFSNDDLILNPVPTMTTVKSHQTGQHGNISLLEPLLFSRILSHFPRETYSFSFLHIHLRQP